MLLPNSMAFVELRCHRLDRARATAQATSDTATNFRTDFGRARSREEDRGQDGSGDSGSRRESNAGDNGFAQNVALRSG
jgi:hypothetical protein